MVRQHKGKDGHPNGCLQTLIEILPWESKYLLCCLPGLMKACLLSAWLSLASTTQVEEITQIHLKSSCRVSLPSTTGK